MRGGRASPDAPAPGRRRRGGRHGSHVLAHLVLGTGGLVMAFPLLWQIIMSLSTNTEVQSVTPTFWPAELRWENYLAVFERLPFLDQFRNSVSITEVFSVGGATR